MTAVATPTARITSVWPVRAARLVHRPYVALAGLQILDVLTTGLILGFFVSHQEGNPVVATLFHHVGLISGLGILLALKLGAVAVFWDCQFPVKIANAIYGLVIFNNALVLGLATWSVLT